LQLKFCAVVDIFT